MRNHVDENNEQHMEFVEHLYTNDTIQISNIDKIDSGVEKCNLGYIRKQS